MSPEEFATSGYKAFHDGRHASEFYKGSWQKRFDDEAGKRYFITVSLWRFPDQPLTAQADVQFHDEDDMRGTFCNVTRPVEGCIHALEAFVHKLWMAMGFGYYERWDGYNASAPEVSPTSPDVRTHADGGEG